MGDLCPTRPAQTAYPPFLSADSGPFGRLDEMEVHNRYKNTIILKIAEVPIKTVVWIAPALKELKAFP